MFLRKTNAPIATPSMAPSRRIIWVATKNLVQRVKLDFEHAEISEKLKALLAIAGKVQLGGKNVTSEDVDRARGTGRNRSGNSRHGPDRGGLLLVQPLRRRAGDLGAGRPGFLPATRSHGRHKGLCRSHTDAMRNPVEISTRPNYGCVSR